MLVLCTFPDTETAREIGSDIIAKGMAVCVNLLPHVESIYIWKGELKLENEVLAIFKLRTDRFADIEMALSEKHPYEMPEIIGVAVDAVNGGYLSWILGKN